MNRAALVLLAFAFGCGPTSSEPPYTFEEGGAGRDGTAQAGVTLRIEPQALVQSVMLGKPVTPLAFKVIALDGRGGSRDVTNEATLAFDGPAIGTLAPGMFAAGGHGGHSRIVAKALGQSVTGNVTVTLRGESYRDHVDATMASAFNGSGDPTAPIVFEYPESGVVLPANLPAPALQWSDAGGDAYYRVVLKSSDVLDYTFNVRQRELIAPAEEWNAIAASAPDEPITITVESVDGAGHHRKSAPSTLVVSADRIEQGAIYTHTGGALRILDFLHGVETALPNDDTNNQPGSCAGCHNVSRDGKRIGFARPPAAGSTGATIGAMRYDDGARTFKSTIAASAVAVVTSTAFNPIEDATRPAMLATFATDGTGPSSLALLDPDTGDVVPSNLTTMLKQTEKLVGNGAAMPNWSNDGSFVVFTAYNTDAYPGRLAGIQVEDGSLVEVPVTLAGTSFRFDAPRALAIAPPGESFVRPTLSADDSAVAFVRKTTIDGATALSTSVLRRSDRVILPLEPATTKWTVRTPEWSPMITTGAKYTWLVVGTTRPYGHLGTAMAQQWIYAIDREKLAKGLESPAAKPFWLPGQRVSESYGHAQWPRMIRPLM